MVVKGVGVGARLAESQRALYWSSRCLGQAGQNLLLAALVVAASKSSTSAVSLSSLFVATLVPGIIFGLPGGAVVDRLGPARGYVLGATARLLPAVGGAFFFGAPAWALIVAATFAAGSQIFAPAEMALVRVMQGNHAGRGHAGLVALQYAGNGLGALILAPGLYWLGGIHAMVVGAAVVMTSVMALTFALSIALRSCPKAPPPQLDAFSFRETCRFFQRERLARYAIATFAFKGMVIKTVVIALPLYLQHDLRLGAGGMAFLIVPGILGVLVGLGWAARSLTVDRAGRAMQFALLGMAAAGLAIATLDRGFSQAAEVSRLSAWTPSLGVSATFVVALAAAFMLGLSISGALLGARVALTETAPAGQQARVFAVKFTITETLIALPLMLAGIGTQVAGPRVALAAVGAMALATVLILELPRFRERLPVAPLALAEAATP